MNFWRTMGCIRDNLTLEHKRRFWIICTPTPTPTPPICYIESRALSCLKKKKFFLNTDYVTATLLQRHSWTRPHRGGNIYQICHWSHLELQYIPWSFMSTRWGKKQHTHTERESHSNLPLCTSLSSLPRSAKALISSKSVATFHLGSTFLLQMPHV